MSSKHMTRSVPDHNDGGALVAYPVCHFLQGPGVGVAGVEEPPVLPVLQQQVCVDEQDGGIVQTGAILLMIKVFMKWMYKNELLAI